jgi:hypothetical protein
MTAPDDRGMHVIPAGPPAGPPPPPAPPGVRRRSALVGGWLLLAAAAAGLWAFGGGRQPAPEPSATSAPPATGLAVLPQLRTALPPELDLDPARAAPLSSHPAPWARLLTQPDGPTQPGGAPSDVFALTADYSWRRIDVGALTSTVDPVGEAQPALDPTSLSSDGRHAAFAQRGAVVVVDFAAGAARRIVLPGVNQDVAWLGQQLLVTQETVTFLLGPDGTARRQPYRGRDVAAPVDDDPTARVDQPAELLQVSLTASHRLELRRWPSSRAAGVGAGAGRLDDRVPVAVPVTEVAYLAGWSGPAWRRGPLVARAAVVSDAPTSQPPGLPVGRILVVDAGTGVAQLVSVAGAFAAPGARVLGWHLGTTLLVEVDGRRVLGYDLRTGQAYRVTAGPPTPAVYAISAAGLA